MVTAILPSLIAPHKKSDEASQPGKPLSASSSELTVTPQRLLQRSNSRGPPNGLSPTRLAGLVGIFGGCGALLALGLFLRLPEIIQRRGISPGQALADSYYVVGVLSLILALLCSFGLRHLNGEYEKGWRNLVYGRPENSPSKESNLQSLADAITLGFKNPLLGMGYLSGFVARASVRLFKHISLSMSQKRCSEVLLVDLKESLYFLELSDNANSLLLNQSANSSLLVCRDLALHPPIRECLLHFVWIVR